MIFNMFVFQPANTMVPVAQIGQRLTPSGCWLIVPSIPKGHIRWEPPMTTCPSCQERIGFRSLLRSVWPVWVTCPGCQAKLAGNRVTLAAVLVQTFLAAAYVLSFGLLIVYTLYLNAGAPPENQPLIVSETAVGALTFVVSAALVWLIIWVPGTLIIWRFGGFYAAGDRPGVASGLRNYFLATSVAALIVLLWAIFYAGYTPISVASLITWVVIVVLALYRQYDFRLGNRSSQAALVILLLTSGVFNLWALVFAVYSGANFPKQGEFQEEFVFTFGSESQQQAWYKLLDLLSEEEPNSEEVLDHLANNVLSVPEAESHFQGKSFRFSPLNRIQEGELEAIQRLAEQGREAEAEAAERYLRLWRGARNLLSSQGGLIRHLVALGQINDLIDFQLGEEAGRPIPPSAELLEMSSQARDELDRSFQKAFSWSYRIDKSVLIDFLGATCGATKNGICLVDVKWPFFDGRRLLKKDHDYYADVVAMSRLSPHQIEQSPDSMDEVAEFEEPRVSVLKNPLGSSLEAQRVPVSSAFATRHRRVEASLLMFEYVMESRLTGALSEPPIDPLTGEPFLVTETGDGMEIRSAMTSNGESGLRYRFQNPAP